MSQSLAKILVHFIFSTKHREPFIDEDIRQEMHAYLLTILREFESPPIIIGSVEDHIHILCSLSKIYPACKIMEVTKAHSSKWVKTKGDRYQAFAWQNGYAAISIGESLVPATRNYIARQREHHTRMTFQEEYLRFLQRNSIPYDERYVWD